MLKTFKIHIGGQVQGVGFRPFIYNLAQQHQLSGTVCNDENGVLIFVNATENEIVNFKEDILEKAPKASIITSSSMDETLSVDFDGFSILPPKKNAKVAIPLTADFVICESCRSEIRTPDNRRYAYPFTSCTQCGPRYSITNRFPFEREHTNMSGFAMCDNCLAEYEDPTDKRFHSQTNCCEQCGISLHLVNASGLYIVPEVGTTIQLVAQLLTQGFIIAIKNTNGYLLCADAGNPAAVAKLRKRKKRPTKPFALLYSSMEVIERDFELSIHERNALDSRIGPIVLLNPKTNAEHKISPEVAPGLKRLGVMLPSTALLTLLADEFQRPLVATSGNIHGSPVLSNEKEAMQKLNSVADYFLHHNLDITFPQDDSVWQFVDSQRIVLRRSRGMAPNFMNYIPNPGEKVLAMGAHLKSTLGFVPNDCVYVTPYFGNLDNYEVLKRYTESLNQYTNIFEVLPEIIVVDKHPSYQSTILGRELAEKWQLPLVEVQHHKAHFASVLAEYNLFETKTAILGVIWDGTGLGDDGMIWGGEFFVYRNHQMSRLVHLEYFASLAGDKMAREPRISLLSLADSAEEYQAKFSATEVKIYTKLKENSTLKTSSIGRLFDAVASLLGLIDISNFEGEAAMLLENLAWQHEEIKIANLLEGVRYENIPTSRIIMEVIRLKNQGHPSEYIAASFIFTLANTILEVALKHDIQNIALSGGVFQNRFLVSNLMELCEKNGMILFLNKELSSNDENIALGQLAYYQNIND